MNDSSVKVVAKMPFTRSFPDDVSGFSRPLWALRSTLATDTGERASELEVSEILTHRKYPTCTRTS